MKRNRMVIVVLAVAMVFASSLAMAQEMTKEQWQQEMNRVKAQVDDLNAKVNALKAQVPDLQSQSTRLDADIKKCMDELYALVGSDAEKAAAYRREIEAAESKANELLRLSDADLLSRSGEVDALDANAKRLWENKLSLIPEFWDRLTALNDKIKSLQTTLAGAGKTYTVGTWARNRDCLWNIAKKSDIYNDAWLWPKIWQGNRDQIRDPDVIHPGQKLKIPAKAGLTSEEKSSANSYYRRKAGN
jgi:nucleoid-associated protein YgaU